MTLQQGLGDTPRHSLFGIVPPYKIHLIHLAQKHHNRPPAGKTFCVHEVLLEQVGKMEDNGYDWRWKHVTIHQGNPFCSA